MTYLGKRKDFYNLEEFPYGNDINRGETFLRYSNPEKDQEFTFGFSWRSWIQDYIHSSVAQPDAPGQSPPAVFKYPITEKEGFRVWFTGTLGKSLFIDHVKF